MSPNRTLAALLVLSAAVVQRTNVAADVHNRSSRQINSTAEVQAREPRILGGREALPGAFPYQAGLLKSGYSAPHCGASIVDGRSLVTAAHCVFEDGKLIKAKKLSALVGSIYHKSAKKVQVSAIFVHPRYNTETNQNDIAVLRTSKNFTFGSDVQSIKISSSIPVAGTPCNVSGWGVTTSGGKTPVSTLRYVTVPIADTASCSRLAGILSGMLCAGGALYEDSCSGDSGGPLVCGGALSGVVSWGYQCGYPGVPGVYTNVAMYRYFVAESLVRSSASKTLTTRWWTLSVGAVLFTSMLINIHP